MSAGRVDALLDELRASGARVTASRRLVVQALVDAPGHHVTVPEVLATVRRVDQAFHESTVYRTLDRLAELDLLTRMETAGGPVTYHLAERAHHHLVCDTCGRIAGADPDLLADVARRVARDHGFVLRAEAVTLPGRCASCAGIDPVGATSEPVGDDRPTHDHPHGA